MFKKILIIIVVLIVAALAALYFYRHAIIKHYTEKLIRENLPGYIQVGKVNFDFANNKIALDDFKVIAPPGFNSKYVFQAKEISCKYGILGNFIPMGLQISDVVLSGAEIRVERLEDGRINLVEMERFVNSFPAKTPKQPAGTPKQRDAAPQLDLSALIKLPNTFDIRNSKFVFIDKVPYTNPYFITVESIKGQVKMDFTNNYSKITGLSFTISGRLNGDKTQAVQWIGSLTPNTPKLTMSNRFEVAGLNILTFEPYYDRFSPFIFKRGDFSGTLVFDFNNGNIGSTNEIHLSNLRFVVKQGYENSQIWQTTVPDLMNYFTTTSGEVVFDFKIKGDPNNPEFYLGPISKRALTSMVINKAASAALDQFSKGKQDAGSDIDKAKEAIDMFKDFLKQK